MSRPSEASKTDDMVTPELEEWAATLTTTGDVSDWTKLTTGQLLAIRKVKNTGLWLNKTATELTKRDVHFE